MLVKLKDISKVVGGATPSTQVSEYYNGNIVWITPKDLADNKDNKYIDCGERNITKLGFEKSNTHLIPPNNILISTRAPIGYMAINRKECCTNQGFKSLICNINLVNVDFLYYYLKTKIKALESLGTGTTFKEVSKEAVENFEIDLPPLEIQDKIANILSNIDNQIERNNAMSKRLQILGNTIYSKIMTIPKTKKLLGELVEMYQPETITSDKFIENGKYPIYGAGGIIGFYDNYNHENSELMVSCRGVCGKPEISLPKSFIIGNQMVIKPNNEKLKYFLYNYLLNCDLSCVETGSVQKQITRTNLEQLSILLPSESIINEHYNVFKNIYDRKIQIVLETEKLN